VIIIVGVMAVLFCGCIFYMYKREKSGTPIFTSLVEVQAAKRGTS
jgi:hypothetical protein